MTYVYAIAVLAAIGGGLALLLVLADRFLLNYGPCGIAVNAEEAFVVEGGRSLLDVLYERRIFIPSACGGQGTCGFCKVEVLAGGGPVLPTELPYLSAEEIARGVRLACQVKVREDLALRVREDFLHVQEFRATVASVRAVTHDTREIVLDLLEPDQIAFRPGQYVQVRVPSAGEMTFRAYSISSAPSRTRQIELLVRLVPGGLGSTYLHTVDVGQGVTFTGPYGEFVLDEDPACELICVGGGCGMAPMRSLLRHVGETDPARACWLFFGARTVADVMYGEEFQRLQGEMPNLHVHFALSEPARDDDWQGETGFIHERVAACVGADGVRQAFLCGPGVMIEATRKVLAQKNLPDDRVFYDEF